MAIPKWTDERTAALTDFVGNESQLLLTLLTSSKLLRVL